MKRLIILVIVLLPTLGIAQGIEFEKGNWASVLAKAKKGNKIIMTDFYTTWCGPCKMMVRDIFPLKNVGDFYNANFINYKIDAEKGEGIALAKKYNVTAYPTYIFTDADGNFLHQAVGAFSADKFISHGKTALDPSKQLGNLLKGNKAISKADMPDHLRKLSKERLPYNEKYEAYINSLSEKELYSEATFNLMKELGGIEPSGFTYDLVLKNNNKFTKAAGKKSVSDYFYDRLKFKAFTAKREQGSMQSVLDEVNTLGFDFADRIVALNELTTIVYGEKGYDGFVNVAKQYVQQYIPNDTRYLYREIFIYGIKLFHKSPKTKAYMLEVADELIAKNYQAASVNAYLGKENGKAGIKGLEKALTYYKKANKIATANGDDVDYAQSIKYISERIATLKKGDYTFDGRGFDKYNGMTINLAYPSPTSIGDFEEAEKVTIVEGKFTLSGNVKTPMWAVWGIYQGDKFVTKGYIILEPGTYPMIMDADGEVIVDRANYNYYVYNSWKTNGDYKKANKAVMDFITNPNYDIKDDEKRKKYFELSNAATKIKQDFLTSSFKYNPDPLVKALVVMEGNLYWDKENDKSGSKRLALLEKLIPDNYLVKTMKHSIKSSEEAKKMRATVAVGKTIKNFTAEDHNGKSVKLEKVLKKNKYVLVEFWASWCGPCRGEIPHMKKAYSHFKDKGFEIVSFSLDHKKHLWDKAYKEEGITWIDTSDLLAKKSPVVKMFGVEGVPANFLVDRKGKIIARDLRQDELDNKLEELLGK